MEMIDLETSITDFLSLGQQIQTRQPLTGEHVLNELIAWYRDKRIEGTSFDEGGDMLLLQWGATTPVDLYKPTDLRNANNISINITKTKLIFLDFTRQVFANGDDKEMDFDDAALQMSITLCYGPAKGDEPNSNLWIDNPKGIEHGESIYRATPFVVKLLNSPAQRAIIIVDHIG